MTTPPPLGERLRDAATKVHHAHKCGWYTAVPYVGDVFVAVPPSLLNEAAAHIAALEDHIAAQQRDMRQMATDFSAKLAALFDAIAQGDDEHRAWLKDAIAAHFAGRPVQPATGSGVKERRIHALETALRLQTVQTRKATLALFGEAEERTRLVTERDTLAAKVAVLEDAARDLMRLYESKWSDEPPQLIAARQALANLDLRAERMIAENRAMRRLLEALEADGLHRGDNYVGDCKVCAAVRDARAALSATQDGKS